MSMSDPIADLLTRIRNGYMAGHDTVMAPHSKLKEAMAAVLAKEGYIVSSEVREDKPRNQIVMKLKAVPKGKQIIHEIKRYSRPGRRVYVSVDKISRVKGGLGVSILTTSRGVMTDKDAKNAGVGGELLCTIW